jgi:putative Holliday junction resolvase
MTLLSLDIGTKRTGVALSTGSIAVALTTLDSTLGLPEQVARLCQDEAVDRVVIGLPMNEDGSRSAQAEWVELEAEKIKEAVKLPIYFEDEVLTTVEARRQMTEAGLQPQEIDQRVDEQAAQLILQQYLNNRGDEA